MLRSYYGKFFDAKEVKLLLRDLPVGEMFRRDSPNATHRYFKTNIKKEEPGSGYYCYNLDGKSQGYFMPGTTEVVRLHPDIDCATVVLDEDRPVPDTFYMCYIRGTGSPTKEHTAGVAKGEAERLARSTRSGVFVLKAVARVTYTPITPIPSGIHWKRLSKED